LAEYVAVPAQAIALKPTNLSFEAAAAVPMAAITALQGLRDHGHIQAGQQVLINGASGGVGSYAVQLAKAFGAQVTAVVSTGKIDLARSLGADHIIDYTQTDFTRNGRQYDLIFDTAGNRSVAEYKRALSPTGIFVTTAFMPVVLLRGLWPVKLKGQQMINMIAKPGQDHLTFMKTLLEAGQVVPVIDRTYPFSETADAFRYLSQGHAKGKVVITVADSPVLATSQQQPNPQPVPHS
jgi:NADPH:quinone reductase-like Zn-dependent oxidoreductase